MASCGDDASPGDADAHADESTNCGLEANCMDTVELEEGLKVDGRDGVFSVEVVSHEPLTPEDNEFVLRVFDADGADVTDATLTVESPARICCVAVVSSGLVENASAGEYRLEASSIALG